MTRGARRRITTLGIAAVGAAGFLVIPAGSGAKPRPADVSANADVRPNPPGVCVKAKGDADHLARVRAHLCSSP